MELNDVLRKVRGLVARAEHPSTPEAEASQSRQMADRLMLKFAIDEASLDASRPAEQRGKPETLTIELAGKGDVLYEVAYMATLVATHCRCKIRNYVSYKGGTYTSTVYGFESDLRYFELLYTTLRLHMVAVFSPSWDESASLEDNCFQLHNAGFNWAEIAKMRGWRKLRQWSYPDIKNPYENKDTGEIISSNKMGSTFKSAYLRACKSREVRPVQIAASGSKTWRQSAVDGYTARIGQRFRDARRDRDEHEAGALVLRRDSLDAFFRDQNPDLYPDPRPETDQPKRKARRAAAYRPPPFNAAAYQRGSEHADTADIGGTKVGGNRTALS